MENHNTEDKLSLPVASIISKPEQYPFPFSSFL